jgi:ferric-dicitrate binding protein FerR (iron transport regulator)
MSDYLFDKAGEPDPELEHLERLLQPLAYKGAPPVVPMRRTPWIVAGVAIGAAAALALFWRHPTPPPRAGWELTVLSGTATTEHRIVASHDSLPVGAWLETGAGRARLAVPGIGTVELGPGTRARVLATSSALHEVELSSGQLVAHVTAPPRRFAVRTPHARVVDLGCAFTIVIDASGHGTLVVTEGAVAVDGNGTEVTVPSGEQRELGEGGVVVPVVPHTPPVEHAAPLRLHHAKDVPLPGRVAHVPGDDLPTPDTTRGPSVRDTFRQHD